MNNPVGGKIARYRIARELTQEELAKMLFRSVSWVKKIESKEYSFDPSISVLMDICRVLNISIEKFLSADDSHINAYEKPVQEIKNAMYKQHIGNALLPNWRELKKAVIDLYQQYERSEIISVALRLPNIVAQVESLPRTAETLDVKTTLYRLVTVTLIRFGELQLAQISSDRAYSVARESDDSSLIALAAQSFLYAQTSVNNSDAAIYIAEDILSSHSKNLLSLGAPGHSILGAINLQYAIASSQVGDIKVAEYHIDQAMKNNEVSKDANFHNLSVNDTNIRLHLFASYWIAQKYGKATQSLLLWDDRKNNALTNERKAHFLADQASMLFEQGSYSIAATKLLNLYSISPDEIKSSPKMRSLVTGIMKERRAVTHEFCQLWEEIGLNE